MHNTDPSTSSRSSANTAQQTATTLQPKVDSAVVTNPTDAATAEAKQTDDSAAKAKNALRFHLPFMHAYSVFGDDWLALKAEAFARFFGTPLFLISQTALVVVWIAINAMGWVKFDIYPFILLNLAFSLQAAYAAPLILLAQTRQADRDKMHIQAEAEHHEALAYASEQREILITHQTATLLALMQQNTDLTQMTIELSQRIENLTQEIHQKFVLQGQNITMR